MGPRARRVKVTPYKVIRAFFRYCGYSGTSQVNVICHFDANLFSKKNCMFQNIAIRKDNVI